MNVTVEMLVTYITVVAVLCVLSGALAKGDGDTALYVLASFCWPVVLVAVPVILVVAVLLCIGESLRNAVKHLGKRGRW